jgi:hypothetical protein
MTETKPRNVTLVLDPYQYYEHLRLVVGFNKKDTEIAMRSRFGESWKKNVSQSKLATYDLSA